MLLASRIWNQKNILRMFLSDHSNTYRVCELVAIFLVNHSIASLHKFHNKFIFRLDAWNGIQNAFDDTDPVDF